MASRAGALPEVLGTDGACADLVPPADVDELTRALGKLLDSPERRRSLGAAGRARAVDVFSWECGGRADRAGLRAGDRTPADAEGEARC